MSPRSIAIAWLRREDWPRWRELDPNFEPDYTRWAVELDKAIHLLHKRGVRVRLVTVDVNEFVSWAKGDVSGDQRAKFALLKANGVT